MCYVSSNLVPYPRRRTLRERGNRVFVVVKIAGEFIWKTCHKLFSCSFDLFSLYFSQVHTLESMKATLIKRGGLI